jgi:leucine dehydrogenase
MTRKAVLAGVASGGAKSVVIADPAHGKTTKLLEAMGRVVDSYGGAYYCAPDIGITTEDLKVIKRVTPYVVSVDHPGAPFTALGTMPGRPFGAAAWQRLTPRSIGVRTGDASLHRR